MATGLGAGGQIPGSGYLERMARTKLPDKARVTIGLKVSEADATQIDQVLTRPEFAEDPGRVVPGDHPDGAAVLRGRPAAA